VAGGEAAGLVHVGGGEQIGRKPGLDPSAHQARRAEHRRGDAARPGREAAQQVGEGRREAARADHVQRIRRGRRRQREEGKKGNDAVTHDDPSGEASVISDQT